MSRRSDVANLVYHCAGTSATSEARCRTLPLLLFWLATVSPDVLGQTVPGPILPGQIEKQFEKPPQPRSADEIVVPAVPREKLPPGADTVRFTLQSVVLEGSSVYDNAAVSALASAHVGREISLAQIYDIANALTARYRRDGYILSQVVVPPQNVRDGVVRLRAVEGYIAQVAIEGEIPGRKGDLDAYAEKLKASRPLRGEVLERYLLLMNDLGGVSARAILSPSITQPGASDLLIQVNGRRFAGVARGGNRGGRFYGPWQGDITGIMYSIFGGFETTAARFVTSLGNNELRYGSVWHEQPFGSEGVKLTLSGSWVDANPGVHDRLGGVRFDTRSDAAAMSLSYPVLRTRAANFYVRGSFSYYNGKTDQLGLLFSEDRIRALRVGASYDFVDTWRGVNVVDVEIAQGLNVLGATQTGSPNLSRTLGHSDFTKVNLYAARLQSLVPKWSALVALNGQYAFTNLLSPELFAFGGEQFGRGYDPAELVGDSGLAMKFEVRYAGGPQGTWLADFTPYVSYDIGKVWQRSAVPGQSAAQSAASAALGVRVTLARQLSGYVEVAKPLTRTVFAEGDKGARLFVGLSAAF